MSRGCRARKKRKENGVEQQNVQNRPHKLHVKDDGEHCMVSGCMVKGEIVHLSGACGGSIVQFGAMRVCQAHFNELLNGMGATFQQFLKVKCSPIVVPAGVRLAGDNSKGM